ncbi:hypothetical protein ACFVJS_28065, partial [Nocardioides sp. NPDC057772]|uniref:hypothetical protein n=1 Tax=Nocardioides sp. NPDC057772 TaxID=3346245 RepID=UPI00366FD28A
SLGSWDASTVGSYRYPGTDTWAHVIPLALDPEREPVAGVLTRHPDGYHLVTILTRRTAFWNVASVGRVPPSWLDGAPLDGAPLDGSPLDSAPMDSPSTAP